MYSISRSDVIRASISGVYAGGDELVMIGPFVSDGCGNRFKSFSIIMSYKTLSWGNIQFCEKKDKLEQEWQLKMAIAATNLVHCNVIAHCNQKYSQTLYPPRHSRSQ